MDIETYATSVRQFAIYKHSSYPFRGLRGEIGEVMEVFAKADRGDFEEGDEEFCRRLLKEAGDCFWMMNEIQLLPEWDWCEPGNLEWAANEKNLEVSELVPDDFLDALWNGVADTEVDLSIVNDLADLLAYYALSYEAALQGNYEKLAGRFEHGNIMGDGENRTNQEENGENGDT